MRALKIRHQGRDESIFAAKPRQQRQVDVDGLAGFAPALNGETADETEPPVFALADRLELGRRANHLVHGRRIR